MSINSHVVDAANAGNLLCQQLMREDAIDTCKHCGREISNTTGECRWSDCPDNQVECSNCGYMYSAYDNGCSRCGEG